MHPFVGTIIQFVGGSISRAVGTALVIGTFFVLVGVTPWEFVVQLIIKPPRWVTSSYFRLGILVIGLAIIWFSLTFNRWSTKQKVIDGLAEDISWAIDNLVNRMPGALSLSQQFLDDWNRDFEQWCSDVSKKLGNRSFFTRADQLHFDYLGFVDRANLHQHSQWDRLLSMLRLKIDRLREVINWSQERRR
jgi:hypothetical protein